MGLTIADGWSPCPSLQETRHLTGSHGPGVAAKNSYPCPETLNFEQSGDTKTMGTSEVGSNALCIMVRL